MPWQEASVVEQRLKLVVLASREDGNVAELCREFGISRQTAYTWVKRYREGGAGAVVDRSRRPQHSPRRTAREIEEQIVALRKERPDWGAPKLLTLLRGQAPSACTLSERTVHRILERHGLIAEADRRRPATKRFERSEPNELWQMDFKGPQGFNKGSPVGPLSILDDHSRYLLALKPLGSTKLEGVRNTLREVFQQVGQPQSMLIDHGTPWWSPHSPWGLTELTVWIMRQGVRLLYSGIRHPQTQGKVERMHGALQKAIGKRKGNPEDAQWLEQFRHEYNFIRPHEALEMKTPSTRWRPSPRPFQPTPAEWVYPSTMERIQLHGEGQLFWRKQRWDVSMALRHQVVGLERLGERVLVYFCNTPVRELDLSTGKAYPIPVDFISKLER